MVREHSFTREVTERLKSYITSRCGLYFKDYGLKDLENIISLRMRHNSIDSPLAYYNYLLLSKNKDEEFRELLNLLTVKHTYFFRNEPQFDALKERLIPKIMERKLSGTGGRPKLRIWSAGCATGEEPYSISIILKEAISDIHNWDIEILATDVSTDALEAARAGVYGKSSVRSVPAKYLEKYFKNTGEPGEDKYELDADIRSMVSLEYFNLMSGDYPKQFDIIFCRNVIIYFNLENTIATVEKLGDSLAGDGLLFIGYSESLQFITPAFKMKSSLEAIYYVKRDGHLAETENALYAADQVVEQIKDAYENVLTIPDAAMPEKLRENIIRQIFAKEYGAAMLQIEEAMSLTPDSPEPYYFAAEVMANQARYEEAALFIEQSLIKNKLFIPAYYLLGSIKEQSGDMDGAEINYKKVLYLDSSFLLANFSLANIYKRGEEKDKALRQFRNTLKLLGRKMPDDIIPYRGGFNVAGLTGE